MKSYTLCRIIVLCLLLFYADLDSAQLLSRTAGSKTVRSLRVPSNFGKTNFIIGMPSNYVTQQSDKIDDNQENNDQHGLVEAYFSPRDDLQQKLIDYIKHEQQSIKLAIFSFTDKEIADALIDAHKRGVAVEVVADPGALSDRFGKIAYLQNCGIKIYVYDPNQAHENSKTLSHIMHNKFVLFTKNKDSRPLVWTGSFNFTKSARLSNRENVIVLSNSGIITQFDREFNTLKKTTFCYNPGAQKIVDRLTKMGADKVQ